MSDLGSDLKGAVLSSKAKTLKVVICGEQCFSTRASAIQWFGNLEECDEGEEDIFLFRCDGGRVPRSLTEQAMKSLARGSHVFQFDRVTKHFVRRDQVWLEHPARIQAEWGWK